MKVKRPALRYHGAKWRLAPWIISQLPRHECYVEPFGGSGAVLLRKGRSWLEVYNDLDSEVVNFFRVLRERSEELIRAIRLTPYAKEEWALSYRIGPELDPLEQARRFYVRAYMNLGGTSTVWRSGWRRQKVISKRKGRKKMTPAALTFMDTRHLDQVVERFRGVQIENDIAVNVVARYDSPETLFYCDPPYPASTRGRWAKTAYNCEMTDDQHRALAEVLHEVEGMVAISGYSCELYDELYTGWLRIEKKARVNGDGSAMESLWLSPNAEARRLPLLQGVAWKT